MNIKSKTPEGSKRFNATFAYLGVGIAILVILFISWLLYLHTVNLLTDNLKNRLRATVTTAAVQFDVHDLNELHVENDYKKPEWNRVVNQLIRIRENNSDIVFAYILRKTEAGDGMEFVADSHSLDPYAKIDLDGNGVIDDSDTLNWPGQEYEDVPAEAFAAYIEPMVNDELYEDQWGILISGYAPIVDNEGQTQAIMVVDMRADDFHKITRQTFLPFLAFIVLLIGIILLLVVGIVHIWRQQIDVLAETDRQKDEVLSIVSHQLATPVSSVKWYLEMLMDGDLGELTKDQKEHVSSMQSIAVNLTDLVSMILDVSRIQLGRMRLEKQELDLDVLFKEILEVIEPKALEKKIKFVKNMPKKMPKAILDRRYTRMTIENLLSNAIKYTPTNGSVHLNVAVNNGIIVCSVEDTGMGIPKDDQAKIFGRMYRASNVRNSVDGNGFGLYIAKGAIEEQGGKIWFESEEGNGTKFHINLPLKG